MENIKVDDLLRLCPSERQLVALSLPGAKVKRRRAALPFPDPPDGLSERAAALWRELGPVHAITTGRRTLFEQALRALTRADAAGELIAVEGITTTTARSGAVPVHPVVKMELEARRQFATLWGRLGLTATPNTEES